MNSEYRMMKCLVLDFLYSILSTKLRLKDGKVMNDDFHGTWYFLH